MTGPSFLIPSLNTGVPPVFRTASITGRTANGSTSTGTAVLRVFTELLGIDYDDEPAGCCCDAFLTEMGGTAAFYHAQGWVHLVGAVDGEVDGGILVEGG